QHIAENAYHADDGSTHFLPLYPLLSRIVSGAVGGHIVWAELIVASTAFVAAMWLLFTLARLDAPIADDARGAPPAHARGAQAWRDRIPRLTVLLTALFPTGFFFIAPFTEGLFLALTVGAF